MPALQQLWTAKAKGSLTSAAVVNGVAYIGSGDGNLYAVNASTGAPVWKTLLAGGGTSSSPAVVNGTVFIGTGVDKGFFYALKASNGAVLWRFQPKAGVASSPAVANGIVYFGGNDDRVYARTPPLEPWSGPLSLTLRYSPRLRWITEWSLWERKRGPFWA